MKTKAFFIIAVSSALLAFAVQNLKAQVPQVINYQARLVDPGTGMPVEDGVYVIVFSLYDLPAGGEPLWTETQSIQTTDGVYSVLLGSFNPLITSLFFGQERYLGVTVGTDPEMVPRKQMVSVPYALVSENTNLLGNNTAEDFAPAVHTHEELIQVNALLQQVADLENRVFELEFEQGKDSIADVEGNVYKFVKIGQQYWMAENLKTAHYNNGDEIGTTSPATLDIYGQTTPKYQWAYDGDENNVETYGRLYTWYTATDSRGVCPTGWHVPADAEWIILTDFLGGELIAGGKLKETGTTHWNSPNTGATNEFGFTALPAGHRYYHGAFTTIGDNGWWWSTTEDYWASSWYRLINYGGTYMTRDNNYKELGLSIRCVRVSEP